MFNDQRGKHEYYVITEQHRNVLDMSNERYWNGPTVRKQKIYEISVN